MKEGIFQLCEIDAILYCLIRKPTCLILGKHYKCDSKLILFRFKIICVIEVNILTLSTVGVFRRGHSCAWCQEPLQ